MEVSRKEEIVRDLIIQHQLVLRGEHVYTRKKLSSDAISDIKKYRNEILKFLRREKEEQKERWRREKEKKKAKYNELKKRLPKREIKSTPDKKKFNEIMSQIREIKSFSGPESEGLNLAVSSKRERLLKEAQRYCDHDLKTEYSYGYTRDGRREVTRVIRCPKCGLEIIDRKAEKISSEAVWR